MRLNYIFMENQVMNTNYLYLHPGLFLMQGKPVGESSRDCNSRSQCIFRFQTISTELSIWLGFTLPVLVSIIRKGIFGISPCLPFSWPAKRWRFSQFNQSPVRSSITSYDWQVSSYNSFVKNNCLWLSCFCITERASLQCKSPA